jgi:hypothetical protein
MTIRPGPYTLDVLPGQPVAIADVNHSIFAEVYDSDSAPLLAASWEMFALLERLINPRVPAVYTPTQKWIEEADALIKRLLGTP